MSYYTSITVVVPGNEQARQLAVALSQTPTQLQFATNPYTDAERSTEFNVVADSESGCVVFGLVNYCDRDLVEAVIRRIVPNTPITVVYLTEGNCYVALPEVVFLAPPHGS